MSRSGYSEDYDGWELVMWRGAVASAIKGKRGQAFLREMLAAMESMPEKRLIEGELEYNGEVCALGSVGKTRGLNMKGIDPEDRSTIAKIFGISGALAAEIAYMNDEGAGYWSRETPESRFDRMRRWIETQLREPAPRVA